MEALLNVRDLVTRFRTENGTVHAVNKVSYTLKQGESLAIVGESGSGKSVGVLTVMGLIPDPPGWVESGEIWFKGRNLLQLSAEEIRRIRGKEIAMIFQDPMTSLNPVITIELQLTEAISEHQGLTRTAARKRAIETLDLVGIPNPHERLYDYPHQFSGGQRQRIMIAMALACEPDLLIADEPTTALDVTIQAQITELVTDLQRQLGMAIIWITHDLGVVAGLVDRVAVMYAGHIVETAPVAQLYNNASHPYTLGLLESIPSIAATKQRLIPIPGVPPDLLQAPTHCPFAPRCRFADQQCWQQNPALNAVTAQHLAACWHSSRIHENATTSNHNTSVVATEESLPINGHTDTIIDVQGLKTYFPVKRGILRRTVGQIKAVDGVDFTIRRGETLGLVGESGCGKSTTGQSILRLTEATEGQIRLSGQELTQLESAALRKARRNMQMIFQDPYASLNPRMTAASIIIEALNIHDIGEPQSRSQRVLELFDLVGLDRNFVNRYPHEFSGGQRQRIGIARALATSPSFIVADEPISALDVSIQAQIVNLLQDLKQELGLTYLFIAHDLSMVRYISDRVAVMYAGKIVEIGTKNAIFDSPLHPYTTALLSAIPVPDPNRESRRKRIVLQGDVPNPANPPSGCRFHPRCAHTDTICSKEEPTLREFATGQQAACHFADKFVEQHRSV